MRARVALGITLLAAWGLTAGCGADAPYPCTDSSQCVAGAAGVCEATGYCSFPDLDCPSGRRYGQLAGDGLGDTCVDEEASTCSLQAVAGDGLTCVLLDGGELQCWGFNDDGQLGDGTLITHADPAPVVDATGDTLLGITAVATGHDHVCALRADGIWCWGNADNGQAGQDMSEDQRPWAAPAVTTGALAGVTPLRLAAGNDFTCAVFPPDEVFCFGENDHGELAQTDLSLESGEPLLVMTGAVDVDAGAHHACALLADHSVWCWGRNSDEQIDAALDNVVNEPVEVATGVETVALGASSTCLVTGDAVTCLGDLASQVTVPGISRLVVGSDHACGLDEDGQVWCWGANSVGQLGSDGPDRTEPTAIDASVGTAIDLAGGMHHTCAVDDTGRLWCWGADDCNQLGFGSATSCDPASPASGSAMPQPLDLCR